MTVKACNCCGATPGCSRCRGVGLAFPKPTTTVLPRWHRAWSYSFKHETELFYSAFTDLIEHADTPRHLKQVLLTFCDYLSRHRTKLSANSPYVHRRHMMIVMAGLVAFSSDTSQSALATECDEAAKIAACLPEKQMLADDLRVLAHLLRGVPIPESREPTPLSFDQQTLPGF
jgi:hypothetical protein